LEKSRDIDSLDYEKLNNYRNFSKFNLFLSAFENGNGSGIKEGEANAVDVFIKCLCKIYMGHTIHQRIKNEISKRTNLLILKGDYFFSLGYYTVSQLGNPLLIKFYAKIAENFARVK
jgi:hypothetical protein